MPQQQQQQPMRRNRRRRRGRALAVTLQPISSVVQNVPMRNIVGAQVRRNRRRRRGNAAPMQNQNLNQNPMGGLYGGTVGSGIDLVASVDLPVPGVTGKILVDFEISPAKFKQSRLGQEADLWAHWRPLQMSFEVVPSAGTFVTGSYMVAWIAGEASLPAGPSLIHMVGSTPFQLQAHVSQRLRLNVPISQLRGVLDVDGSDNTKTDFGKFIVILTAPIANLASGSINFTVHLTWRVQFSVPASIMSNSPDANYQLLYADPGWSDYFTDSVSGWFGGKYLTLKEREGGDVVPFSQAREDVIYELDRKAVLSYYKDSTARGNIRFGVKMRDYKDPGLAVFERKDYAEQYIKTRNVSTGEQFLLQYVAAGDRITPDDPAWTAPLAPTRAMVTNVRRPRVEHSQLDLLIAKVAALELALAGPRQASVDSAPLFPVQASGND